MTQPTKSLNDILDEALDDFACPPPQSTTTVAATKATTTKDVAASSLPVNCFSTGHGHEHDHDKTFASTTKSKPSQASTLPGKDSNVPSLESDIRRLSDMMQEFMTHEKTESGPNPTHSPQTLNHAITEALKSLDEVAQSTSKLNAAAVGAPSMQDLNFSEFASDPEMAKMFHSLWEAYQTPGIQPQSNSSTGHAAAPGDPFDDSVLESLVNQLLSKDILFEPLKDLDLKYPQWLAENHPDKSSKLSTSQYQTHARQADYLHELILLWESEEAKKGPNDETVNSMALDLLQKVQDCGPPPEDLLPKIAESSTSGIQSLFPSNTSAPECSIM